MRYVFITAMILMFFAFCKNKKETTVDPDIYYTCSMDPQVVEYKPGKCPICKMDLTPVQKKNGEKQDEIQLSEQQILLGNIKTDTIRNGSIGDQLVLTGTLNFDQLRSTSISARVMGRVEKLFFKNLGDYIKSGSPLYELYSEDLNNAKQEYLLALDRKQAFAGETVIDFDQLMQGAKNKLLLWGMSERQLQELAKTKKTRSHHNILQQRVRVYYHTGYPGRRLYNGGRHGCQAGRYVKPLGRGAGIYFSTGRY